MTSGQLLSAPEARRRIAEAIGIDVRRFQWMAFVLAGGLAGLAFAWRVGSHLVVGDPWSAAWLGLVVMSCSHWPIRHPTLGLIFLTISARVVQS